MKEKIKNWLLCKGFITILRKFNKQQKMGLKLDEILDKRFGKKKSEEIQDALIGIMENTTKQFKADRKKK